MSTDPQAMEMMAYPMDEWLRWEREHCDQEGHLNHATPVEDCPLCRYGCQVFECGCS